MEQSQKTVNHAPFEALYLDLAGKAVSRVEVLSISQSVSNGYFSVKIRDLTSGETFDVFRGHVWPMSAEEGLRDLIKTEQSPAFFDRLLTLRMKVAPGTPFEVKGN